MQELTEKGKKAKEASYIMANISSEAKNNTLLKAAENLESNIPVILKANAEDLNNAEKNGLSGAIINLHLLTE
jgi:glutamate-5-semialdehyde dehydrogenase